MENGDCGSGGMKLQLDKMNKSRDLMYSMMTIVVNTVLNTGNVLGVFQVLSSHRPKGNYIRRSVSYLDCIQISEYFRTILFFSHNFREKRNNLVTI